MRFQQQAFNVIIRGMNTLKVRPLDGITVIALEHAIAAPFCTRQLADLGARVIKIERPEVGDFARGLMMSPKVLMLDEPSLGLAPQVVLKIMETLKLLSQQGLAIILVEQVAMLALEFSKQALVLKQGQMVSFGESQKLLNSPDLVANYLS